MRNKRLIKHKFFTLIEALVAIAILSIILSFGMQLLSQQMKAQVKTQAGLKKFYQKTLIIQELEELFFKLASFEKKCLVSKDDKISLIFDFGITKNPDFSGLIEAVLKEKKEKLILSLKSKEGNTLENVILDRVQNFKILFYSEKLGWQSEWFSSDMGLPEMVHLKIEAKDLKVDQKFLLPFNLHPINTSCKSFPSSFL